MGKQAQRGEVTCPRPTARAWQSWDSLSGVWDPTSCLWLCLCPALCGLGQLLTPPLPWSPPSVGKCGQRLLGGKDGGPEGLSGLEDEGSWVHKQPWELRPTPPG